MLNEVRGLLRGAVLRAGGREIDARADEFFAVFERPRAAIEAAVAIQRALGAHAWPDGLEVRVRAGIHSGRPTLTDVGYIGLAVHTTARVCSAAHGGQIVVSEEARAAVGHRAAGRRPLQEPRAPSPGGPSRSRGALPGPGEGTARGLPAAAHRAPGAPRRTTPGPAARHRLKRRRRT